MLFHLCKKIQKGITTGLILSLFVGLFAFAPITPDGKVPKAEALLRGGSGCTGCLPVLKSQLAQDLLNTGSNAITAGIQQSLFIKEWTMDGVFNGLAKLMIKSMTISIVNWINSGFQGKPAFLQDLKQYVLDRADKIAGDFIYNDPSLSFLCSPFQLDVKIALATSYQQEAHGGFDSQCTLSEVTENVEGFLSGSFSEGGWQSWFEVTQNPVNTPTGAFLAAEAEMYARIVDDQGRAIKELDWGEGFLSFKVCADTENQKGCDITTPGTVIANQINKSLGAGQDAL